MWPSFTLALVACLLRCISQVLTAQDDVFLDDAVGHVSTTIPSRGVPDITLGPIIGVTTVPSTSGTIPGPAEGEYVTGTCIVADTTSVYLECKGPDALNKMMYITDAYYGVSSTGCHLSTLDENTECATDLTDDVVFRCQGNHECHFQLRRTYSFQCSAYPTFVAVHFKCVDKSMRLDICNAYSGSILADQNSQFFITTPDYPSAYKNKITCKCDIIAQDPAAKIRLEVVDFYLEDHHSCEYDYLEVYEGFELIDYYCGQDLRGEIYKTKGDNVTMYFHSDDSQTDNGFWISFDVVPHRTTTNKMVNVTCGDSDPPPPNWRDEDHSGDGSGDYNHGTQHTASLCITTASTNYLNFGCYDDDGNPDGSMINIHEAYMAGTINNECTLAALSDDMCKDPIEDTKINSCVGHKECYIMVKRQYSETCDETTNYAHIDYECIPNANVVDICRRDSYVWHPDSNWGAIISPNYPNSYLDQVACQCNLSTDQHSRIFVHNLDFHLEESDACQYDYVEFIEGAVQEDAWCDTIESGTEYKSSQNHLSLVFKTDANIPNKGFWFQIEAFNSIDNTESVIYADCGQYQPPVRPPITNPPPTTTSATSTTTSTTATWLPPIPVVTDSPTAPPSGAPASLPYSSTRATPVATGRPLVNTTTPNNQGTMGAQQDNLSSQLPLIIGAAAGGTLLILIIVILSVCMCRRKQPSSKPPPGLDPGTGGAGGSGPYRVMRNRDSVAFDNDAMKYGYADIPANGAVGAEHEHIYESIPYDNLPGPPAPPRPNSIKGPGVPPYPAGRMSHPGQGPGINAKHSKFSNPLYTKDNYLDPIEIQTIANDAGASGPYLGLSPHTRQVNEPSYTGLTETSPREPNYTGLEITQELNTPDSPYTGLQQHSNHV
ncbi:unnamed protein product [Owenia fusiformis]|uniref:Uncharacterized protein n=1 Tax=Owenia fusiformis TaxID=6347 RepID=A0A8J1TE26_OWEFU|nr:unnamed protein product [Owenia fusiformis]